MSSHVTHDLDELSDLLDGRLPADRREAVEERLRACDDCVAALDAMRWARAKAGGLASQAGPRDLEERLRAAMARADASRARRPALLVAAGLIGALAGSLVLRHHGPPAVSLPEAAAAGVSEYRDGGTTLDLATAEPASLEAHFAGRGLDFPTRVFDLGMMGYRLEGGRVAEVSGRPAAFFVYRDESGAEVVCQMFRGRLVELPPPVDRRSHGEIPFQIYRSEGFTLVFWPEGDVLCVLSGEGDPEALIELAFAKAMKARKT
jgi:anti-sigma factor RsiW